MSTPEYLIIPDSDDTRDRIVRSLAYAHGFRDVEVDASPQARTLWHIQADAVLVTLRGITDAAHPLFPSQECAACALEHPGADCPQPTLLEDA